MEAYLHTYIPLSAAIGVGVETLEPGRVALRAPLDPNLNHRDTAFGGSVAALAILTGWTLVHFRLRSEGRETHTVIQESSVRYDAPVADDFLARSEPVSDEDWSRFTRALTRWGKARVRVSVVIESAGVAAGAFEGAYVAISR